VIQTGNLVNNVSAQIQLSERDQAIKIVDNFDEIVCKIEYSEFSQVVDVVCWAGG
jgi:hypothetical protein